MDDPLGEAHLPRPYTGGPRPSRVYRSQPPYSLFSKPGDSGRSSDFAPCGSTPKVPFAAPVLDQECIASKGSRSEVHSYNDSTLPSTRSAHKQARSLLDSLVGKPPPPDSHPIIPRRVSALNLPSSSSQTNFDSSRLPPIHPAHSWVNRTRNPILAADANASHRPHGLVRNFFDLLIFGVLCLAGYVFMRNNHLPQLTDPESNTSSAPPFPEKIALPAPTIRILADRSISITEAPQPDLVALLLTYARCVLITLPTLYCSLRLYSHFFPSEEERRCRGPRGNLRPKVAHSSSSHETYNHSRLLILENLHRRLEAVQVAENFAQKRALWAGEADRDEGSDSGVRTSICAASGGLVAGKHPPDYFSTIDDSNNRINPRPQEIGDRTDHIQEHSPGPSPVGWDPPSKAVSKECYPDISVVSLQDVLGLPSVRRRRPKWRWPYSRKRSKLKHRLASSPLGWPPYRTFFPGSQFVKGCSADPNWEPGGSGDPFAIDLSIFSGYGCFPDYLGPTNGDSIWSGQGPGSELQQALETSEKSHQAPLDSIELTPDTLVSQPYYYDRGNLPVRVPPYAPPSPVPLLVHCQLNARGPDWNSTGLVTNAPAPQPQDHNTDHSAINAPSAPSSTYAQPSTHESERHAGFVAGCKFASCGTISWPQECTPEWNAGFHAGCMFANRTSVGSSSAPRPPPGPASPSAQAVALLVPAANEPNADILSLPTVTDPDHSTTQTSPLPHPFQESADRVVADQSQAQPSSSTTERIARRGDTPHDSRTNAISTSLESAPGANDASTNSSIGPTRRGRDRNRYACDVCDKKFPQKQRLDNHIQRHHRGQPNAYLCDTPLCGRSFASRDGLKRHRKKCNLAREISNLDQR